MRVLWFTNTSSLFKKTDGKYHGGGWIESLEAEISSDGNTSLGISFFSEAAEKILTVGNTKYYPLLRRRKGGKLMSKFRSNTYTASYLVPLFKEVIDDFKPDVIHIFGSEESFGLISLTIKDIPIILHIQGMLNPYLNAYFPPNISMCSLLFRNLLKPMQILFFLNSYYALRRMATRESIILRNITNYMGRTDWDRNVVNYFSPKARYFMCNEILRKEFYIEKSWEKKREKKLVFCSVISPSSYKGLDLILKTSELMFQANRFEFEWHVLGVDEDNVLINFYFRDRKITRVKFQGNQGAETVVQFMLNCDLYIHPSYAENSPNSICEAQILGVPIVATFVGGVSSLIENNQTGTLIPANDPYFLASICNDYYNNPSGYVQMANNGKSIAQARHNKNDIIKSLKLAYRAITN